MPNIYEVAIGLLPHIGNVMTKYLISYCGSAEMALKTSKTKLLKIPNVGEKITEAIQNQTTEALKEAEKIINTAEKQNAKILFYTDSEYPKRLKSLQDSPYLLFYKGNVDLNRSKVVSIVGTRKATNYGKEMTEQLVLELKKYNNLLVISGLAYGIDIAAHRACVKNQIANIGVLGSGIDVIYPDVHQKTAEEMLANGGLLSEFMFGTKPDAPNFPARNRIIAGMSDAVIVVEAAQKGGALITAEIANTYNREVFAIAGRNTDKYSEGCNHLIKTNKANLITSVADLDYILKWDNASNISNEGFSFPKPEIPSDLSDEEMLIFNILESGEKHIDELSVLSQISINQLASVLLNLEFKNLIKQSAGKKFRLNGRV